MIFCQINDPPFYSIATSLTNWTQYKQQLYEVYMPCCYERRYAGYDNMPTFAKYSISVGLAVLIIRTENNWKKLLRQRYNTHVLLLFLYFVYRQ